MESLPDCRSVVRKLGRRKVFFDVALGKISPPAIYSIESDSHDDAGPQSPEHGIEEPRAEQGVQAHRRNAGVASRGEQAGASPGVPALGPEAVNGSPTRHMPGLLRAV